MFKIEFDTTEASGSVSFHTLDDASRFLSWLRGDTYNVAVMMHACGANKIQCIKTVREITGLSLKDAKDVVESPVPIQVGPLMSMEAAQQVIKQFDAVGANARIERRSTTNAMEGAK